MLKLVVCLAFLALAFAEDCEKLSSKSDCESSKCSWCTSGAVGDSCMSPSDAAALPSAVFTCTGQTSYYFLSTNDCESVSDESKCTTTSGCSWCDSAAVGSSCMSSSDAAALPAAIFTCKDASVPSMLGASDKPGTTWEWSVTLDMFEGVIGGFFNQDAPDLKGCANNAVNVYDAFNSAIKELNSDDSTITKVENGMGDMGNALLAIEELLKDCQNTAPEIKSLVKTITDGFKSPASFAYHVGKDLIVNGVDIYHEITTSVSDWNAQSYKACGNEIGLALHAILVGKPEGTSTTLGGSYYFLSTNSCEALTDENNCTGTSGCSWCDSAAVGSSCMSSSDAAALPAAIFTCKDASIKVTKAKKPLFGNVAQWFDNKPVFQETTPVKATSCESFSDKKTCLSSTQGSEHCAWCSSGAVGSSCYAQSDAQDLPSAVFDCSYSFQYFPEEEVSSALYNSDVGSTKLGLGGGYQGVDISQLLTSSTASCFADNNIGYVIARGYTSVGSVDPNGCSSLTNAQAAGIPIREIYMFPCPTCSSASAQVSQLTNMLGSCGAFTGTIWLDIEGSQYWLGSSTSNRSWYQDLVDACKNSGYSCGVYSSYYQWSSIFGSIDYSYGSYLPLWYAHYDGSASFSDFSPFGGWNNPSVKQYNGDKTLCGMGVDQDYGNP